MRYGGDLVVLFMLGGGVMFTLLSVAAWVTGRRVAAVFLAVVAGANLAFAIGLLNRGPGG
ncbi:MAG: hypothetical protein ACM3MJ_00465 [Deltaproteobacteria bacterium]